VGTDICYQTRLTFRRRRFPQKTYLNGEMKKVRSPPHRDVPNSIDYHDNLSMGEVFCVINWAGDACGIVAVLEFFGNGGTAESL
jgi:hypothetical protein